MRPSRRQTQLFPRHWPTGRPSVTVLLVAGLAGAFVAQWMLQQLEPAGAGDEAWLLRWLAVSGETFAAGDWWQLLTFGFLHAHPLHVLLNLLGLYFAGREVEPIIGSRPALGLFLAAQMAGGIIHALAVPGVPLVGVSAGVAAFVAVFATVLPELEVTRHLLFVIPLKLRAKYFGLLLALASVLCASALLFLEAGSIATFAGCIVGWLGARRLGFGRAFWFQRLIAERRQREARLDRMPAEQFLVEEVDPILEKIAQSGMESLTRAERKLLERGREKMSRGR